MKILIIGNGFDLAHNLPTSYKDFIDFANVFVNYKVEPHIENLICKIKNNSLKCKLRYFFSNVNPTSRKNSEILRRLTSYTSENVWISHFRINDYPSKWIDFEAEIKKIIMELDGCSEEREFITLYSNLMYFNAKLTTKKEIQERLIKDLNDLISCFEIYLTEFVYKILSEDAMDKSPKSFFDKIGPFDKILSFNYTNTYQKKYDSNKQCEYDYIHGEANCYDESVSDKPNNMVLGIDDYLSDENRRKKLDFIEFQKFYQIILKQTGMKYKHWLTNSNSTNSIEVAIFGHSLGVTDKEILCDFLLNDNITKITIFYLDKEDLANKICNLIKLIGREELIARTGEGLILFEKICY